MKFRVAAFRAVALLFSAAPARTRARRRARVRAYFFDLNDWKRSQVDRRTPPKTPVNCRVNHAPTECCRLLSARDDASMRRCDGRSNFWGKCYHLHVVCFIAAANATGRALIGLHRRSLAPPGKIWARNFAVVGNVHRGSELCLAFPRHLSFQPAPEFSK